MFAIGVLKSGFHCGHSTLSAFKWGSTGVEAVRDRIVFQG